MRSRAVARSHVPTHRGFRMRPMPRLSNSACYIIGCAALVLSSCRADSKRSPSDTSATGSSTPRGTQPAAGQLDSIAAVRIAMRAFPSESLSVVSFKSVGTEVEISLEPVPPGPGYVSVGGGGIVRVAPDGTVRIIERYR